ncbi:hypothetical protein [Sphingomonas sp. RS2018]
MTALLAVLMLQATTVPGAAPAAYRGNLTMEFEFQPPDRPATASADGDLTVTARRTYRAKMATRTDRATRTRQCTLRQGFGLAAIDPGLCGTLLDCMSRNATRALVKACMLDRLLTDLKRHYGASGF